MRPSDTVQPRVLSDFEGLWRLERTVRHHSGDVAVLSGQAEFTRGAEGMDYVETGTLVINDGAPIHATRRYTWREGLDVYFDDGRFFHRVPADGGRAVHWCDPDTYQVEYTFTDWPRWRAVWRVTGPKKDYVMESAFSRA